MQQSSATAIGLQKIVAYSGCMHILHGTDTPMPPCIGKAFTCTNFEDLSPFRYMIMVCE